MLAVIGMVVLAVIGMGRPNGGAVLADADLREAHLARATLAGATLAGAGPAGANLVGANVSLIAVRARGRRPLAPTRVEGVGVIGEDLPGGPIRSV